MATTSLGISGPITYFALGVLVLACLMVGLYIDRLIRCVGLEKKMRKAARLLAANQSQLKTLRFHASDYFNTIGPEGAKLLGEITEKLDQQTDIIKRSCKLLPRSPRKAQKTFESIDWESDDEQLQEKIENLGTRLANASKAARKVGIPSFGRLHDADTLLSLKALGIDVGIVELLEEPEQ